MDYARASRSGRRTNGRMDGRTGPTCAQCTAMLNEECWRPGRHQYRGNFLNYGSACVFQEDRWNLMEPNGYSFEVKVCLSLSRRADTFLFLSLFFQLRDLLPSADIKTRVPLRGLWSGDHALTSKLMTSSGINDDCFSPGRIRKGVPMSRILSSCVSIGNAWKIPIQKPYNSGKINIILMK